LPNASRVIHSVDSDDDEDVATNYLNVDDSDIVYVYRLQFTPAIESDEDSDALDDYEDEKIEMLGKTFTIVQAETTDTDAGIKLTLMGGAETDTIDLDAEKTYTVLGNTYAVKLTFVDATTCAFTVNGEETERLSDGETDKLADGTQIGVTEVYYQEFAGGVMRCKFYLGAEKVVFADTDIADGAYGEEVEVNDEDIDELLVQIEGSTTLNTEAKISYIKLKFTAEDDYYVDEDGLLSSAVEDYQLFGNTFDFEFKGFTAEDTFDIELKEKSGNDEVTLTFTNIDSKEITVPLFYNGTAVDLGEALGKELVTTEINNATDSGYMIQKDDFFIVTSGDNTCVYEYKGEDDSDKTLRFESLAVGGTSDDYDYTTECAVACENDLDTGITTYGNEINLCGAKNFYVFVQNDSSDDSEISIDLNDDVDMLNGTVYIKTQYEAQIDIEGLAPDDSIRITPDANAFDDDTTSEDLNITFAVTTPGDFDDVTLVYSEEGSMDDTNLMHDEKDEDDDQVGYTMLGMKIFEANDDSHMDDLTITVPEKALEALVFVKEVGAEITAGTGGGVGGAAVAVMDTEFSSVQTQNIITIGGSAINSVSADLLGLSFPTYGTEETWINATGVDTLGEAIIKIMDSPWTTGKFAMLVAGYEGTDTLRAAKVLREGTPAISGESVVLNTATEAVTIVS